MRHWVWGRDRCGAGARRSILGGLVGLCAALGLAGCASGTPSGSEGSRTSAASAGRVAAPRAAGQGSAAGYYRLVQYPGAGFGGFYAQIAHARRGVDMEMYELEDATAEQDLAAAAARGVKVRVLLDKGFSGGEVNQSAAGYLSAHGVEVRWAPAGFIFHIKATTFDGSTTDISTANLVSKDYRTTRDAEIVDTNPQQVSAVEATFSNDWAAGASGSPKSQTVQAPGLIWSPNSGSGTAETALVKQIGAARKTVDFESEELSDSAVYGALAADARRGVRCRIVMTRSSEWDAAFRELRNAGCQVHVFPDSPTALYIHEKLILDDQGTAHESLLIGSQNASHSSLTENRELGILLNRDHGGRGAIAAAAATFESDFVHATDWSAPTPKPKSSPKPKPTPPPASNPQPKPAACYPTTSSGHCYEPGEYCSHADHGMGGIAGDGEAIVCEDNDGWRWEPK